jgi:ClpP class serine protease
MLLLAPDVTSQLRAFAQRFAPTAADLLAFDRETRAAKPRQFTARAGDAVIAVHGVLTQRPSLMFSLFGPGSTTYAEIVAQLDAADADPSIKRVVLDIDSPGGVVAGLFHTLDALGAARKPVVARATSAQSAAYAIAAAADKIEAVGRAAMFGSVGVAADITLYGDEISITNTDAPDKRPDLTTAEGRAVITRELDQVATIFYEAIARGRSKATKSKITTSAVRANYGRGSTLLADAALAAGMIDVIGSYTARTAGAAAASSEGDLGDKIAARLGRSRMADAVDLDTLERPAAVATDDTVPTIGTGRLPTYRY